MSGTTAGAAAAVSAAVAAAAARRRRLEEEDRLATYEPDELEGWEFKFLRSATGRFRKPEALRRWLDEEAEAGWELLELFDDRRLRLKRPVKMRERDRLLDRDPYRVWVGVTPGQLGLRVLVGGLIAFAIVVLAVLLAAS